MGQLLSNNLLVVFCPLKIVVGREPIGFDGAAVSNLALDKIMQGFWCNLESRTGEYGPGEFSRRDL